MDLYSRKIIAWTLSKTLEVEEVLKCLETAKKRRKSAEPLVIHADYAEFGIVAIAGCSLQVKNIKK